MVNGKKVVSSVMAVVLALGLCPVPAFAVEGGGRLPADVSDASRIALGDPVALDFEPGQLDGLGSSSAETGGEAGLEVQDASLPLKASGTTSVAKPTADDLRATWKNLPQQPLGTDIFKVANDNDAYAASVLTDGALSFSQAYLNFIRSSAGLSPITLTDALNLNAAQGALILSKLDKSLTHTPETPSGVSDVQAKPGKYACATSNISYAAATGMNVSVLKGAIQGQVDDSSSSDNLSTLGHRRWLLNPKVSTMGIGSAYSYSSPWHTFYTDIRVFSDMSSDYYDASYGTPGQSGAIDYEFIAWPASGAFANNVFSPGTPWSVTLNPNMYQAPTADVQVKVTRLSDNRSWIMTGGSGSTPSKTDSYLVVENSGYGVSNCIIFNPGSSNVGSPYEGAYQVEITGLKTAAGASAELAYEVDFIDASGSAPAADPGTNPGTNPGTDPDEDPATDLEPTAKSLSSATVEAISDRTYSGQAQQPVPVVRYGSVTLRAGTDFEVVGYADNTAVGTASVTIAGKGDYKDSPSTPITFRIVAASIASAQIELDASVPYTGVSAKPPVAVSFNGKLLVEGTDYTLAYSDNTGVGTAYVTVNGTGNFTGSVERAFEVVASSDPTSGSTAEMRYGVDNAQLDASMVAPAGDFQYGVAADGTAVISGYSGSSKRVVVPCKIDGHDVIGLFVEAFSANTSIEEVYLPDTVEVVEEGAFEGCTSLKCLNLGGIRKAFSGRTTSRYTTDASGFQRIISRCTGLKRLTMSDNANFAIERNDATGNNFNIMTQDVLDGIEYIYLGSNMATVPVNLFYGESLQRADVGKGNKLFSSVDGAVYDASGSELLVTGTGRAGHYDVPKGVERIGSCGFQNCASLTKVSIPESVTAIDKSAFSGSNATIVTPRGSYAAYFAQLNGISLEYNGVAANPYQPTQVAKVDISRASVSGLPSMTYTGKAQQPKPSVRLGGKALVEGVDYTLSYANARGVAISASNVKAAGAYRIVVRGMGAYDGETFATFNIAKAPNPIKVKKVSSKTVKASKLRKKAVTVKLMAVKSAYGKVSYAKSGSARLSVSASGKITVKKGTPRGAYTARVKVKASGDANHVSSSVMLKVTVRVK